MGRKALPGESADPKFRSWFITEKSDVVRKHMIRSVRLAAILGDPPERFYTNASESTNNILKQKVDRKSQTLPDFVNHLEELARAHENSIE